MLNICQTSVARKKQNDLEPHHTDCPSSVHQGIQSYKKLGTNDIHNRYEEGEGSDQKPNQDTN